MKFQRVLAGLLILCFATVLGDSSGEDDSGEISVPRRPKISGPESVHQTYFEGDELEELVCLIEGTPTPTVIWFKDGKRDTTDDLETEFDGKEGKATLEFKDKIATLQKTSGNYSCIAGNFLGRASKTYRISVLPKITSTSSSSSTISSATSPQHQEAIWTSRTSNKPNVQINRGDSSKENHIIK